MKIEWRSNVVFRGLISDLLLISVQFFCKKNAIFSIEQKKCRGHEKEDRISVLKVDFNLQISQRNKNIYSSIHFSRIDLVYRKSDNINLFLKLREA